jgi:hypothetical protein
VEAEGREGNADVWTCIVDAGVSPPTGQIHSVEQTPEAISEEMFGEDLDLWLVGCLRSVNTHD